MPVVFEGGDVFAAEPEALPVGFAEFVPAVPEPEAFAVVAAALCEPSVVETAADCKAFDCEESGAFDVAKENLELSTQIATLEFIQLGASAPFCRLTKAPPSL